MAAGLGFKTFTVGEVLSAADVNGYLMQGVLVFATTAARDAAITSPQEGQFAFTKDTNSLFYYDGAAWVASGATGDIEGVTAGTGISGGGTSGTVTVTNSMATEITAKADLIVGTGNAAFDNLAVGTDGHVLTADSTVSPTGLKWAAPAGGASGLTLITPTSIANSGGSASLTGALTVATGVTSVSLNGVFSATYTNYLIEVFALSAVGAGGVATRLRAAGVDTSGSNYQYAQNVVTYAGVGSVGGLTTSSNWDIGTGSVLNVSASSIFLFNPFASTKTNFHSVHSRNVAYGASGGMQTDSTSFDGISFIGGGTDISLSVLVYGFEK